MSRALKDLAITTLAFGVLVLAAWCTTAEAQEVRIEPYEYSADLWARVGWSPVEKPAGGRVWWYIVDVRTSSTEACVSGGFGNPEGVNCNDRVRMAIDTLRFEEADTLPEEAFFYRFQVEPYNGGWYVGSTVQPSPISNDQQDVTYMPGHASPVQLLVGDTVPPPDVWFVEDDSVPEPPEPPEPPEGGTQAVSHVHGPTGHLGTLTATIPASVQADTAWFLPSGSEPEVFLEQQGHVCELCVYWDRCPVPPSTGNDTPGSCLTGDREVIDRVQWTLQGNGLTLERPSEYLPPLAEPYYPPEGCSMSDVDNPGETVPIPCWPDPPVQPWETYAACVQVRWTG